MNNPFSNPAFSMTALTAAINILPNLVSKKALMNVAGGMRNAWDIVEPLALRANLQARRQTQLRPERRNQ